MPAPQDVRKKGSKILKLPPVHNCFTLTMTNKSVVNINSLKYQKLRKFYYRNEISCTKLQLPPEPLTRGLPSPDPRSLCPVFNWICWTPSSPPNKIPGYATDGLQGTLRPGISSNFIKDATTRHRFFQSMQNKFLTTHTDILTIPKVGIKLSQEQGSHQPAPNRMEQEKRRRRVGWWL